MVTETGNETLDTYLLEVQRLKIAAAYDPHASKQLIEYVKHFKDAGDADPNHDAFFKAEYAFHNGHYDQALVSYMQARGFPRFEFFCYRATAFVSFARGNKEKAMSFINKALEAEPSDYISLEMKRNLLKEKGEQEEIDEVTRLIEKIEKDSQPSKVEDQLAMQTREHCFLPHKASSQDTTHPLTPIGGIKTETTNAFVATKLGVDLEMEKAVESRIQAYQRHQGASVQKYLEEWKKPRKVRDHTLLILSGFRQKPSPSHLILDTHETEASGGFFIRWNGKGIAVNPGPHFLDNFHHQGLHMNDINYVVVTRDSAEAHGNVQKIYDLNCQLNKINPELHVIHYYLNHNAYQNLAPQLQPNFKQERHTVHSLELFLDSPDVEKETLGDGITLNYFSTAARAEYLAAAADMSKRTKGAHTHSLGIRFDLSRPSQYGGQPEILRIGYASGTVWSPLLGHHFGSCDILIAGFGSTCPNDYGKLNYNEHCLGYFGTCSLLEEVKPKLMLSTEFHGKDGDIRLEVAKKLRKEYQMANPSEEFLPAILPADSGLFVDLAALEIECSVSKELHPPQSITVVKTSETFGALKYLSPSTLLQTQA